MTAYDHFAEANRIADSIEAEGFAEQAGQVRHAIAMGRSGTELFMQLRFYLAPLAGDVRVDPATRQQISTLVGNINEALSP
jgi:hypothetical protein